ncbi:neuronal regeneration-related protein isoform X1 [Orcinus orca]|uniref:Neuronal regeneration-related protein isoform X1 n=2 Tax=Odontoceti TaxID=9722 RepID=A0A2U4BTB8_TURTR|nr:neuronal regeneration-related protein isoform X1 [Tursiops truncatus]XP_022446776.1 neuronal regeneration-related protein isoform X1 [Delphinapterus leucas]XP_026955813.1 neuronal regeneration-related protein isoform X1 [Lagenorhynchus obliquidens]XP_030725727.1 neuronal regeneration-related protein isoform X1 [Globicephala melas]XP_033279671.1 neuronal regeneration-related protein isoform X1 [Orcinus orca]XP_059864991.1 neuronal regeneration-related protein isoform X1 [Delphinus delphis]X
MQRPGRLHAWLAPKPPPPPPYLSEKQPHVEAKKPAGATEAGPACREERVNRERGFCLLVGLLGLKRGRVQGQDC